MRRLAIALALAAACAAPFAFAKDVSFDLDLVGGIATVKQRYVRVSKDDEVTVRITSDVAGDVHLHGYKLETKVKPGARAVLKFKAFATGRYPFDWHPEGAEEKAGHAHARAPATLEVRPR